MIFKHKSDASFTVWWEYQSQHRKTGMWITVVQSVVKSFSRWRFQKSGHVETCRVVSTLIRPHCLIVNVLTSMLLRVKIMNSSPCDLISLVFDSCSNVRWLPAAWLLSISHTTITTHSPGSSGLFDHIYSIYMFFTTDWGRAWSGCRPQSNIDFNAGSTLPTWILSKCKLYAGEIFCCFKLVFF